MKSEYFKNRPQTSQLRVKRDKEKPEQVNWDRIVYLTLLFLVLGALSYYLFVSIYYITGEGLVIAEELDIQAPGDILIEEYMVSKSSEVDRGTPLFRYTFISWRSPTEEMEEMENRILDIEIDIEGTDDQIFLKRQSIKRLEQRIDYLKQQKEEFEDRVRLNVSTSFELNETEHNLFNARSDLDEAEAELTVLIENKNRLEERQRMIRGEYIANISGGEIQTYLSPADGEIHNIYVKSKQQAFRTERILSMKSLNGDVYIYSVFDREDARKLTPGTVMTIEFDNGEKSKGRIRDTYDAREDIFENFKQTGSITAEHFVVELVPIDSETRSHWRRLNRVGLQIYKPTIGWLGNEIMDAEPPAPLDDMENDTLDTNDHNSSTDSIGADFPESLLPAVSGNVENSEAAERSDTGSPESFYGLTGSKFDQALEGYTINVSSFETQNNANEIARKIKHEGFRVDVRPVMVLDNEYWRVGVGQFKTRSGAIEAVKSLPDSLGRDYFIRRIQLKE